MKTFTILFVAFLFVCEHASAQRNVTVYGGLKFIEYRGSNIWFWYRDESPAPDNFFTDIELSGKTVFNLGFNYNNYSKTQNMYWDAFVNLFLGKYFGIDGGGSIGYPFFITGEKNISFLPSISGGVGYYNKSLGTLENHTTWIQVNDTRFQNFANVDLSMVGWYAFIRPNLAFVIDVSPNAQIILSGSYSINIDLKPEVSFTGPDQNGTNVTANEDLDANNLAFYIDNKRTNDSPFKLMGPEVRLGVNFGIGR
jgi:hypothetical protein